MKKFARLLLCVGMMAVVLFTTISPALAASSYTQVYSVKTLKPDTYVSGKNNKYDYDKKTITTVFYKITTAENGYITITNQKVGDSYISVYRSLAEAKKGSNALQWSDKKTIKVPLKKGTYYIEASYNYKFKFTFKAYNCNTGNCCFDKATTLKASTTKTICAPWQYNYNRWYKITLDSKKKVSVTFKDLMDTYISDYPDFRIIDSNGKSYGVTHTDGYVYQTNEKLAKGTYYIIVLGTTYGIEPFMYSLNWK